MRAAGGRTPLWSDSMLMISDVRMDTFTMRRAHALLRRRNLSLTMVGTLLDTCASVDSRLHAL